MIDSKYGTLEHRCKIFALRIRNFSKQISPKLVNIDDIRQLIRSSGSIGANYIEANNSLGSKDFLMRIKICKKEAEESAYWLELLKDNIDRDFEEHLDRLNREAIELTKIFGAIVKKYKNHSI